MPPWKAFLVSAALLVSACIREAGNVSDEEQPQAAIQIQYEDGSTATVAVGEGNGTVLGNAHNDAGDGLPGVHISLIGSDFSATTNETGWFEFRDVAAGDYLLRADDPRFRAVESPVQVLAGKVARVHIMMLNRDGLGGGDVPHTHDYWNGRTEVTILDESWEWHRPDGPGGLGRSLYVTGHDYYGFLLMPASYSCSMGHVSMSHVRLDDPGQFIFPGTTRIEFKPSWNPSDFVGGDTLWALYTTANSTTTVYKGPPMKNGQTVSIPVEPKDWDAGHSPFTFWQIALCATDPNTGGGAGKWFMGKIHLTMKIFGGTPPRLEDAHRRFWENGTTLRLLNEYRNWTCASTATASNACYQVAIGYVDGRGFSSTATACTRWCFTLPSATLVPPGTAKLRADLNWVCDGTTLKPLSLTYSPANVPPRLKSDLDKYKKPEPGERRTSGRTYEIALEPGENDGFYQKFSNWRFLWSNEGEEKDDKYNPSCGSGISVRLTVDAIKAEASP